MPNERMRISMYMIQQSESFFVSLSAAKHYALVYGNATSMLVGGWRLQLHLAKGVMWPSRGRVKITTTTTTTFIIFLYETVYSI